MERQQRKEPGSPREGSFKEKEQHGPCAGRTSPTWKGTLMVSFQLWFCLQFHFFERIFFFGLTWVVRLRMAIVIVVSNIAGLHSPHGPAALDLAFYLFIYLTVQSNSTA